MSIEAATPGEIKAQGKGWEVNYGMAETLFGRALIGVNHRGVCHLSFHEELAEADALQEVSADWPMAKFVLSPDVAEGVVETMFGGDVVEAGRTLHTYVKGTKLQVQVWRALLELPVGAVSTYSELARKLGRPDASRAVGSAIGRNALAYLIPCHRVIRKDGGLAGYRWGEERKRIMLAAEAGSRV